MHHFPGEPYIHYKDKITVYMNEMKNKYREDYSFYPDSFVLPK